MPDEQTVFNRQLGRVQGDLAMMQRALGLALSHYIDSLQRLLTAMGRTLDKLKGLPHRR